MKRIALFLLLFLLLLPMGSALAQDDDGFTAICDPNQALNDLVYQFSAISGADQIDDFLLYALNLLTTCGESWVARLGALVGMMPMMGMSDSPAMPLDTTFDPYDGIVTPEEAEYAILQVYTGEIETGIAYFCATDQADIEVLDDESLAALGNTTVNSLECRTEGDQIACDVDAIVLGDSFNDTVYFDTTGGVLCSID